VAEWFKAAVLKYGFGHAGRSQIVPQRIEMSGLRCGFCAGVAAGGRVHPRELVTILVTKHPTRFNARSVHPYRSREAPSSAKRPLGKRRKRAHLAAGCRGWRETLLARSAVFRRKPSNPFRPRNQALPRNLVGRCVTTAEYRRDR
jgi:hypothetical protein